MQNPDSQKVTAHIQSSESQYRETITFLRELFLNAGPEISEHIKWNSPSFYYNGEMKESDAKEYRRDLAVINLHRGKILLVFPTGNRIDKKTGLNGKDYPDGRKIVEIESLEHAKNEAGALREGIISWLDQIEK